MGAACGIGVWNAARRIARGWWRGTLRSWRRVGPERLRWTVRIRAVVIAVFLVVALGAWAAGTLPSLAPGIAAAAAGIAVNQLAARRIRRWERIPAMLVWTGASDALLITVVVVATGGAASPFLFLYVVQVLTTALVVDVALGAAMGVASLVLFGLASGVAPSSSAPDPVDLAALREVWLASFGVTLLLLVFVGGYLARRLARSERRLAATHRRLARSMRRLTTAHASLQDAYARLARAESELVETDRARTMQLLVAGLAHELGNPLTVLAGNIEPLTEAVRAYERALALAAPVVGAAEAPDADLAAAFADAAEARHETPLLLANCAEATSRATALLGQLRDFGRGGRGTVRRLASIAPGLIGTLALLRYRLPAGVTVHESYADVPDVLCVPAELNQVFINLMLNAIDVLAPGGNLWLGLACSGGEVRVDIRDDGPGIAPEVLARLFEPFVTTKEAGRGTGLGLAISRAIVGRHGGRIDVATGPGQGTAFTVRLPVPA
jgi:signal transduction histidine kinase